MIATVTKTKAPTRRRRRTPPPAHATIRVEFVHCGGKCCTSDEAIGHGPYRYAYWRGARGTLKKRYLGRLTTTPTTEKINGR